MGRYTYDRDTKELMPYASCDNLLHFYGVYNPKIAYHNGDIVMIDDLAHVYLGNNRWEPLGVVGTEPTDAPKKITYSHCKSCGAPVDSYKRRCEYCGVEYQIGG